MTSKIVGNHHITLSTGGAQEDWDFHTQTLGLRPVKKTMLYDGTEPVYHLYYANADIDAGSILTCFPMRQQGKIGRRGSNQVKEIGLSVDEGSIDYWANRLDELGFATEHSEALGTKRLSFAHPCGIPYTLVGTTGDTRRGYGEGGVPGRARHQGRLRPGHLRHRSRRDGALPRDRPGRREGRRGRLRQAFDLGGDDVRQPHRAHPRARRAARARGTSPRARRTTGPGTSPTRTTRCTLKGWIEGLGFTDVTEQKDRGYFLSLLQPHARAARSSSTRSRRPTAAS